MATSQQGDIENSQGQPGPPGRGGKFGPCPTEVFAVACAPQGHGVGSVARPQRNCPTPSKLPFVS